MRPNRIPALIILLLIGGAVLGWFERLAVYDWWRLDGYHPSAQIQQLADQTTMTSYGRHLFYVYHPQLESSAQFNRDCSVTLQVVVLGCTVSFQGIYLYNVQDPQLNGLDQVTAAYEMLHVGYARLSSSQRVHIDSLVLQAYNSAVVGDPELAQERASYLKTEGQGAVANELHSMMGTEVATLPPELETYYAKYFTNRPAILAYKNQYESVFVQRQATVTQDDQLLAKWKTDIASDEANLTTENRQLGDQSSQLNAMLSAGQDDSYNAGVPAYNAAVASYNRLADQTRSTISEYNQVVAARNAAAVSENQLYQTISSQPLSGSHTAIASP